jgi:hypothetical protein
LSWKLKGKCANDRLLLDWMHKTKQDAFFDKQFTSYAKQYCLGCPVIEECFQEGLQSIHHGQVPPGVWGGRSERERRAYLRNLNKRLAEIQERMQKLLQGDTFPNAS